MKKTELLEIIRAVVREEVNSALPQLLMEVLAEKITNNQDNLVETRTVPSARQTTASAARPQPTPVRRKPLVELEAPLKMPNAAAPKVFSSNPALNAVLNETAGDIVSHAEMDELSPTDAIVRSLPPELLQENSAVAAAVGAMTRDYSKVLKAVESKVRR